MSTGILSFFGQEAIFTQPTILSVRPFQQLARTFLRLEHFPEKGDEHKVEGLAETLVREYSRELVISKSVTFIKMCISANNNVDGSKCFFK